MSILHNLLQKVNSTPVDSAELDKDIIAAFPTAFDGITKSIDAIVRHAPAHLFPLPAAI